MAKFGVQALAALAALALAGCAESPPGEGTVGSEAVGEAGETVDAAEPIAPEDSEYCPLTGQEEALGECARFERQYADLDAGRDAFSPQESMKEGETLAVSYAVTRLPKAVQGEGGELAEAVEPPPPPPPPPPPAPPMASGSPSPDRPFILPPRATEFANSGGREPASDTGAEAGSPAPDPSESPTAPLPTGPTQEEIDAAIAETDEQNAAALGDAASEIETGQIKVARFMYACLRSGPALTVKPEGCQSRDTREDPQVVWNWQVTAKEPGSHTLNLRSGVEVRSRAGEPRRIGQRAVNRTITVAVSRIGWFERAMAEAERWFDSPVKAIGALTALLLAIGGLVAAIRKLRKGGDDPEA